MNKFWCDHLGFISLEQKISAYTKKSVIHVVSSGMMGKNKVRMANVVSLLFFFGDGGRGACVLDTLCVSFYIHSEL